MPIPLTFKAGGSELWRGGDLEVLWQGGGHQLRVQGHPRGPPRTPHLLHLSPQGTILRLGQKSVPHVGSSRSWSSKLATSGIFSFLPYWQAFWQIFIGCQSCQQGFGNNVRRNWQNLCRQTFIGCQRYQQRFSKLKSSEGIGKIFTDGTFIFVGWVPIPHYHLTERMGNPVEKLAQCIGHQLETFEKRVASLMCKKAAILQYLYRT